MCQLRKSCIKKYQHALKIRREIGDRAGEATSLNNLGSTYHALGNYEEARQQYEQALKIFEHKDIGARAGAADSQNGLGAVFCALRKYEDATKCLEKSLNIRQEIGDRAGEGDSLCNLGNVYYSLKEYEKAINNYYKKALGILQAIGHREFEAKVFNGLGDAYHALRQYENATKRYEQAWKIFRDIGNGGKATQARRNQGNACYALGEQYYDLGQQNQNSHVLEYYKNAVYLYEQALTIRREIGDHADETDILDNLGNAYYALGEDYYFQKKYQDAIKSYKQALIIRHEINDHAGKEEAEFALTTAYIMLVLSLVLSQKVVLFTGLALAILGLLAVMLKPSFDGSYSRFNKQPEPTFQNTPVASPISTLTPQTPPPEPQAPTPSSYRVICSPDSNRQALNVRQSPSLFAPVVATIPCNAVGVQITGEGITSNGEIWVPIQYQTIQGWSVGRFLSEP